MPGLLKGLKKQNTNEISVDHHYKYIVVGAEISSLLMAKYLTEKFGPKSYKLIVSDEIKESDLIFPGPSTLRGQENFEVLDKIKDDLALDNSNNSHKSEIYFYKENDLHLFSEKFRPTNELKFSEKYFTNNWKSLDLRNSLYEDSQLKFKKNIITEGISSIVRKEYKGRDSFVIVLRSGMTIATNHLFFGESPANFYRLFKDKNKYSNSFHEFFQSFSLVPSLVYSGRVKGRIFAKEGTFFLPQLVSDEKGHFIGEINTVKTGDETFQDFSFFCFIGEDENISEEIQKKIKLLKRVLKRIFPDFGKVLSGQFQESIVMSQLTPNPKIHDYLFDNFKDETSDLTFLGIWSPIASENFKDFNFSFSSRESISDLSRSLLSFYDAKKVLEKNLSF